MAWYSTGSITATNNSGAITGVGTLFMANVRVGDGITIAGSTSTHEVVNVTSDTQLTVSPVYAGTTGSGKTFGIVPVQGYTKALADQAKQLILAYSPFSTVTGGADKFPYYTSSSNMAAASLTPAARALLDDVDVATMQTTLGLVPTTGSSDTTAGRLLKVGDFGLGSTDLPDYSGDLNALNATGFYLVAGTNMPSGQSAGFVTVQTNALNNIIQTFISQGTTTCFERACGGGVWGPWRLRYNQASIIGTVSQSAGVPTGAIIERGSNANGEYVKFADGTLICTCYSAFAITLNAGYGAGGGFYTSSSWTFPVSFATGTTPATNAAAVIAGRIILTGPTSSVGPTLVSVFYFDPLGTITGTMQVRWLAVGRWF